MSNPPAPSQVLTYYATARPEILPLIGNVRNLTTLDVGCGEGSTSALLRERQIAKTTLGIEYSPAAAEKASAIIDRLKVGDVETIDLSDWHQSADLVLCLDVLEHLANPWAAIKRLASCVKPGGRIITSIPNVQNKAVVLPLLRGEWNYAESGQLDRTHLRFFTHQTARNLIESGGFTIESESAVILGRKAKLLSAVPFLRGFFVWQYLIVGRL